jgi:hypothetical protein
VTSAIVIGGTLIALNRLNRDVIDDPAYLPKVNAPVAELTQTDTWEGATYKVWWVNRPTSGAEPGRYLVDPATGQPKFRDDPGIGGIVRNRADGTKAEKFPPPQPALFAVIIDGILTQKLAWALVILGASLAVVMQLSGVSALAFAVGVYLPLSTTLPIFVGGMIRGLVDRVRRMSEEESDSSPAVLLSSGLIAGGSIAGIMIAFLAVAPEVGKALDRSANLPAWLTQSPEAAVGAFGVLVLILAMVGLKGRPIETRTLEAVGDAEL